MTRISNEAPATAANQAPSSRIRGNNAGGSDLPPFLTTGDLAEVLRCSSKHISNLAARGVLRPLRLGRSVRFRRESVLRALATMEGGD